MTTIPCATVFLVDFLDDIEDPRVERARLHSLHDILVTTILAVICGADSWTMWNSSVAASTLGFPPSWTCRTASSRRRHSLTLDTMSALAIMRNGAQKKHWHSPANSTS